MTITVPFWLVVILGILACSREAYNVFWIKNRKNVGALFANSAATSVYIALYVQELFGVPQFHGSPWVRWVIFLLFLDKAIVFLYEIREYKLQKRMIEATWNRLRS